MEKDPNKKDYLEPEEAIEIIENGEPHKVPPSQPVNGNGNDKSAKEAELLGSTKEAIQLKMAELKSTLALRKVALKEKIDTIRARESAKEVGGKHLAKFGAFYLCLLVLAFLASVKFIAKDDLAIVATLITLVVTQISSILKGITDVAEKRDPTELMHDIVLHQLQNDLKDHESSNK
tara:strand:+ start:1515 stop:2045 length:531 start_codon:yes stop_codon:yes gene_type:complete